MVAPGTKPYQTAEQPADLPVLQKLCDNFNEQLKHLESLIDEVGQASNRLMIPTPQVAEPIGKISGNVDGPIQHRLEVLDSILRNLREQLTDHIARLNRAV